MQKNKWILQDIDKEYLHTLQQELNLPEVVLKVLLARGVKSSCEIKDFIFPKKEELFNPYLLGDMYKAVTRIKQAIENKEKILIYADRDVDGITSLAVLYNTIFTLGGDVVWYIPSDEGYGLSCSVLDKYKTENVKLIITVDCGISAVAEIDYANSLGMEVVVTDHHEPPQDGLPKACCVVDPKVVTCNYPFKELAGCGVSFKVSQALMQTYGKYFDKEIAILAVKNERIYLIVLVNDVIVKEKELLNKTDLTKFSKIVTNSKKYVEDTENKDIEIIEIEEDKDIKQVAYDILKRYRNKCFDDDGRMLEFFENNIDLVALGTVADIVPLTNENRILVKSGLSILNDNYSKRLGLGYIFEEYLKNSPVSAKAISWKIAPILNAAGRMGKASVAANLILADDNYNANNFFVELKKLNNDRKELQNENIKQFNALLKQQCDTENDNILVVSAKNLMHGVTGIVASQMVKLYGKPVILFIEDLQKGEATGACRSIDGFDIVGALDKTKDLLIKFGGHNQAAGLTIENSKIDEFRKRIKKIAKDYISTEMVAKKINVDCELKITEVNKRTYNDLTLLEPFGASNSVPIFMLRNVGFEEISVIGQTQEHLKLKVCKDGMSIPAVFWGAAKYIDDFGYKQKYDILFNMDFNRDAVQLIIMDVKIV
ncbi:single-stranded-DNA-specific exonuclease RecJ [Candidatus Ruminimicrobiellum ovillum]|uniref:single-stranded-DNA-specific exonuclease RecJ n=1 Tax=Candidatus Ruminimicrobiellum ovillum TaxID=1947927 RepID=UPI00355A537A